jgi:hypothetical protein
MKRRYSGIAPRGYYEIKAIDQKNEPPNIPFSSKKFRGGNPTPMFNGSGTSRKSKKRPITLPNLGKFSD